MIEQKYQSYPDTSESGIEWVGNIPTGWGVRPFFVHAAQCKRPNKGMANDNLLSLSYGSVIRRNIATAEGLLPESFETYQVVEPSDLVFRLTDLQNDWRSLRSALCSERGIITSAYLVVTPQRYSSHYMSYLMRAYDLTKVFYALGSGLRQSLKYSDMRRLPVLVPPSEEQTQIAKFLDYETAKIDALIEKQQQLIALLKEKRQAVISHAVTKGLNPDAPMRDSGVEWLGEVPAHWEVAPLKYKCELIDGDRSSAYPSEEDLVDEGIPFVSSKNISDFRLTRRNLVCITQEKFDKLRRGKLRLGDLVITVRGTIGNVGVFFPDVMECDTAFINAQMMIMRPIAGLTAFLALVCQSYVWQEQLDLVAYGSTVRQLSNQVLGNVKLAVPPSHEVGALVDATVENVAKINSLVEAAQSAESLLNERRTALISAAVTGKIDVRDWKAPKSEMEEVVA